MFQLWTENIDAASCEQEHGKALQYETQKIWTDTHLAIAMCDTNQFGTYSTCGNAGVPPAEYSTNYS